MAKIRFSKLKPQSVSSQVLKARKTRYIMSTSSYMRCSTHWPEGGEHEDALHVLLVHGQQARLALAVDGGQRLELAVLLDHAVAGRTVALLEQLQVVVEGAGPGDGVEGRVRHAGGLAVAEEEVLALAVAHPADVLADLLVGKAQEGVVGLVVVVVGVEDLVVHGNPPSGLQVRTQCPPFWAFGLAVVNRPFGSGCPARCRCLPAWAGVSCLVPGVGRVGEACRRRFLWPGVSGFSSAWSWGPTTAVRSPGAPRRLAPGWDRRRGPRRRSRWAARWRRPPTMTPPGRSRSGR